MKAAAFFKKHLFLFILLFSILGLVIVNLIGVYKIYVLPEDYTLVEFSFGFLFSFVLQLVGVAFIGYEGRDTSGNMALNVFFYFFLVAVVVSIVLYTKYGKRTKK